MSRCRITTAENRHDSLAFAPREALQGQYLDTSREAFGTALEVSAHSLAVLAKAAAPGTVPPPESIVRLETAANVLNNRRLPVST